MTSSEQPREFVPPEQCGTSLRGGKVALEAMAAAGIRIQTTTGKHWLAVARQLLEMRDGFVRGSWAAFKGAVQTLAEMELGTLFPWHCATAIAVCIHHVAVHSALSSHLRC